MHNIYLAPLQGFTDHIFRELYFHHFAGIDRYFTPFIQRDGDQIRKRDSREIASTLKHKEVLIPQIIANNSEDICWMASYIKAEGYNEINLNIGCPFPMLVRRKMGAGMLPFPDLLDQILESYFNNPNHPKLSVKMRLGMENSDESSPIVEILNRYPLTEVILHPRTGKQQYKGTTDLSAFKNAQESIKHPLVYNGDITTTKKLELIKETIPTLNTIMIGRGILSDPFLPERIKGITNNTTEISRLLAFHNALLEAHQSRLSGDAHLIHKMMTYWEYLAAYFDNPRKVYKAIKKVKTLDNYQLLVRDILC